MADFILKSNFKPTGDQPGAVEKLTAGLNAGLKEQVLLGVTGSGKTYTVANVIRNYGRPTLVISHNKTLAAQLAQEYREFFPQNAANILFPIMTIISRRPIYPKEISILKRKRISTIKLTNSDFRRHLLFLNDVM